MKTEEKKIEEEVRGESPTSHLLDMLVGWSAFVDETQDGGKIVTSDEIGALYQEAGGIVMVNDEDEKEARVREFVESRVIPLLLRKA